MWVWVIFFCFQLFQYYLKWSIKKEGKETLYIKDQDTGKPDTPQVEQIRYRTLFCGNENTACILYVCAQSPSRVRLFYYPTDCGRSSVYGTFQAKILAWVAIFRGSSPPRDRTHISCISCIGRRSFTTAPPGRPISFQAVFKRWSVKLLLWTDPSICQLLQQCDMSQCGGEGLNCHGPQPGHKPPATGEGEPLCPTSWGPPQPPESVTMLLGSRDALLHNYPAGKMPWITTPLCNSEFRRPEPCWVHLLPSAPCWILFFSVHLWSRAKLGVLIIWIIMVLNFLSFFKKQHSEECLKLYGSFI